MLNKWLLMCGVVITSLVYVSNSLADSCGGGAIQEGGGNAGYITCIERQQPEPYASPSQGNAGKQSVLPGFDPSKVPIHELTLEQAVERIAESPTHKDQFEALYGKILFNEPQQGLWVLTPKNAKTDQCSATFFERPSLTNGLIIMGPSSKGAGAMLFQGNKLPRAYEGMVELKPTLTFSGQKPIPVNAALIPAGVLVLTDAVALMRAAKDSGEVSLQLEGKEVFKIAVSGIAKVRNPILNCMGAQ